MRAYTRRGSACCAEADGGAVDVNSEDQLAEGIEAHHHADWLMAYAMLIQRTVTERL